MRTLIAATLLVIPIAAGGQTPAAKVYGATMADGKRCAVEVQPRGTNAELVNVRTYIKLGSSNSADAPYAVPINLWGDTGQPNANNELIGVLCQRLKDDIKAEGRWPD